MTAAIVWIRGGKCRLLRSPFVRTERILRINGFDSTTDDVWKQRAATA